VLKSAQRANVIGGLLAIAVGVVTIVESSEYAIGTVRRMGPGFFPIVLAGLMVTLGIGMLLLSRRGGEDDAIERPAFRGILFVMAGILAFALLIDRLGLAPAVTAAVVVSAMADPAPNLPHVALLALGTAALTALVFVYLLGLNMPVVQW
jgi:hypothetical protein